MKSFTYEGRPYNLTSFALAYHVSYSKLRRLCRHYKRAHDNPAVACNWILEKEILHPEREAKTIFYRQDLEKSYDRHERFLEKVEDELLKCLKLTV